MTLPVVFSLSGPELLEEEARFFEENAPHGYILFKRNVDTPDQLEALTKALKNISGQETHIMVDQEGGRVQRLKEPHWPKYPCMRDCQEEETLKQTITALSKDLIKAGIDTNCAPVLDVLQPDTDNSIGDRAFSEDPNIVIHLADIACQTFLTEQITPVIKHLPGHGRAIVDSHEKLPVIEADIETLRACDFIPFQKIIGHTPYGQTLAGMVGHCLYTAIDEKKPASLSEKIIEEVIRDEIGLRGLLYSDDLSMGALGQYGDIADRAELCLEAGCDIALYCAGKLDEMRTIALALS